MGGTVYRVRRGPDDRVIPEDATRYFVRLSLAGHPVALMRRRGIRGWYYDGRLRRWVEDPGVVTATAWDVDVEAIDAEHAFEDEVKS